MPTASDTTSEKIRTGTSTAISAARGVKRRREVDEQPAAGGGDPDADDPAGQRNRAGSRSGADA